MLPDRDKAPLQVAHFYCQGAVTRGDLSNTGPVSRECSNGVSSQARNTAAAGAAKKLQPGIFVIGYSDGYHPGL
jgi:hypothetical protein